MDSFTENQLRIMKIYGGNHRCNSYLLRQGILTATTPTNTRGKYDNEVAETYKMMLKARLEGQPDPPNQELRGSPPSSSQHKQSTPRPGQQPTRRTSISFANTTPPPFFLSSVVSAYKFTIWTCGPIVLSRICDKIRTAQGLAMLVGVVAATFNPKSCLSRRISGGAMAVIGFVSCAYVPIRFASAFRTQRLPAHQVAVEDYTERCKSMRAKRNNGYEVFFPPNVSIGDSVNKAFIFYSELLVDHMAYAIVLGKLSDRGILVLLVNAEPSRCCTEIATVNHLKRLVYEITTLMDISVKEWVLGGHSLGGLAASAIFMKNPPSEIPKSITRLVQWTVPGKMSRLWRRKKDSSCSTTRLKSALRINATRDGVVVPFDNGVQYASTNNDFPDDDGFNLEIEMINGGNHSGFAHYGPQLFPMDWERRGISLGEQQAKVVNLTADFILESNRN